MYTFTKLDDGLLPILATASESERRKTDALHTGTRVPCAGMLSVAYRLHTQPTHTAESIGVSSGSLEVWRSRSRGQGLEFKVNRGKQELEKRSKDRPWTLLSNFHIMGGIPFGEYSHVAGNLIKRILAISAMVTRRGRGIPL